MTQDNKPEFIDNLDGNTTEAALKKVLNAGAKQAEMDELRIATAFFTVAGFARVISSLQSISSTKLLLGSDPIVAREVGGQKQLGEVQDKMEQRSLKNSLRRQEESIRKERDFLPFTSATNSSLRRMIEVFRQGRLSVRRFEDRFLHAKAYIFSASGKDANAVASGIIAGSSNLTTGGLVSNLELNLGRYDKENLVRAKKWFDDLWEKSIEFDLASLLEELFNPRAPFEIFMRILWELYGSELEKDDELFGSLPLTEFQKHGVMRGLRLIEERGGTIIADEVGLGKTYIAAGILSYYRDKRQRALLICPAALRDSAWKHFRDKYELYLETVSFEELSQDEQLHHAVYRPKPGSKNLARDIEEYQLIIIDEAHNYRNPSSHYRAGALRALLYGKRKDVLMLTATPVNNSLWDLYHLLRFFAKQDTFLANTGILSIRERFEMAMQYDPDDLSPDILYPIIDATTVKRTRQFIKKHYEGSYIEGADGKQQPIVFPEPKALTIRYELDELMPDLFDLIEKYLDPENKEYLKFARYNASTYLLDAADEDIEEQKRRGGFTIGLLRSNLLKRFESSIGAFSKSVDNLVEQHKTFLEAIEQGYVITTKFLEEEASSVDEKNFLAVLQKTSSDSRYKVPIDKYDIKALTENVQLDLEKLEELQSAASSIQPENDPKLKALVAELEKISAQAKKDATGREEEIDNRKVVIFSFFADSVRWARDFLKKEIETNPKLSSYKSRGMEIVVGSGEGDSVDKDRAAARFAPKTAGGNEDDKTDILISTDVLAEGVNLQQARNIINYDLPWNPMRLVQRHGRIDRIGSNHKRVFLRTIFPADRLDTLLRLEERIKRKISMAAASVGVVSPIAEAEGKEQSFAETKEEIIKLMQEDASLYEKGGTTRAVQTGEEYRHALRKFLEEESNKSLLEKMPWKSGSGIRRGNKQGMLFCAKVGERTYLRFVYTDKNWNVAMLPTQQGHDKKIPHIEDELAPCLRMIECSKDDSVFLPEEAKNAAHALWQMAQKNIYAKWMHETDPANLQPSVRAINRKVADFIRNNMPQDTAKDLIEKALDIVESPWPRRDEDQLREWFAEEKPKQKKSRSLVEKINQSGMEPSPLPELLPIIELEDINLLVWMAVHPAKD